MKRILKMLRGNRRSRQHPQGLGTPMFERLEPRLLLNAVPYMQDFSLGKPGGAEGWEYYSNNEGRIEVVGGRLRLDDSLNDQTLSLNEAILHVDLTGQSNVVLELDHWSLADESNTLPSSFVGHYKGDGISLSVDGQNWVKVTDLAGSFLGGTFNLDTFLQQAKVAAGSSDLSDVRIKFQQYDNLSATGPDWIDGREFDNIRVTVISVEPEMEVLGNGQEISDGDMTPSAVDHTDFGSVGIGGSLTRTFTIRNTGSAALNLTGVPRVQWTGSTDFTVVQQPSSTVSAYGGTTTFQMQFTPSGPGLKTATVWISNNDGDENPYNFVIQGTGLSLSPVAQPTPYTQDFSLGKPGGAEGWEYYSNNEGRIEVVGGRLRLDDSLNDQTLSLNEAILHVDLTGKTGVTLTLDHWSLSDESNTLPGSFVGHYKGDGISLSVDGQNWVKVTDLAGSFLGGTFNLDTFLQQAQVAAGSSDLSDVRIKFQQYDNLSATGPDWTDGREFDNIQVTGQITTVIAQLTPYTQDFSLGKPTGSQGWEYYSDNEGRIAVVGGRLRMDDTLGNETYSPNEAILHVDLTGKTGVTLTLDHWSLSDESNTLPGSFVGHYKGDGISLSVDGQNWVKVTDLSVNFTNQSFALDTILQQAKVAAGSTDLSDVRIKFQQYDNYPALDDGREFDNIRIT